MNANPLKSRRGFLSRRTLWFAVLCLIVMGGISYGIIKNQMQEDPVQSKPIYAVQEGPLTISVTVSGTIQAREKVTIQSELEGSSTILYLRPEGERVKKGDMLVELDASNLIDQRVDEDIKVQNAEAAYISARENLEIVKSQAKSDIDKAQLTFDFAKQDYKKYIDGDYPKSVKEARTTISTCQETLNLAKDKVKWSQKLFDEQYLSKSELQTDELSATKAQNSLDLANADLALLQDYTYKRQIAQLISDVTQAEMALERTGRQANANIVQASATLQAKLSEFEQEKSKLQKINDQIGKAKIYAPMDGLVVYATSVRMGGGFRGGSQEPLEEGQTVRERQELIYLPTTSSYMVQAKVPESSLEKIHLGLPVRITIDALPGKVYTGKVGYIAPLPDPQSIFMNPDLKVYDTQIYIDGEGEDLRSGMGAQTQIIADYFENTTYVPVQAVLRVGGKPTVFLVQGNNFVPREVELGPDNNSLAQIKSGLKKGEVVLLTPPLSAAKVSDEDRFRGSGDVSQMVKDAKDANQARLAKEAQEAKDSKENATKEGSAAPGGLGTNPVPPGMDGPPRGDRGGNRGDGGPGAGGGRSGNRPDFQNMTQEQREQMRQRFQNMTQEERDAMRQRNRQNRENQGQDQSPQSGGAGQE